MDMTLGPNEFIGMAGDLFLYGCLWIHQDQLEAVREIMTTRGQDTAAITRELEHGYRWMGTIHCAIQACIQHFRLRLGVSRDQTRLVIEEEID